MIKRILFVIAILNGPFSASAAILVENPWVRASSGPNAALFMTLHNNGDTDDVLTKVEVDTTVCARTELHTHKNCHGVMKMREVSEIKLEANNHVSLAPGGLHVMLMKLAKSLKESETISVTCYFKNQGPIKMIVPVKAQ